MTRWTWAGLLLLSALWGAAYLAIDVALRGFPPVLVVLGRVALAAAILLPIAWHRRVLAALCRHPWRVVATVLVQSTAPLLLLTYGQRWLSSSLTGILIGAQPLFVALLATRFDPEERPQGASGVVGLLLGMAGLVLIFGVDLRGGDRALLGGLLVVGAALCYAVGALLIHRKLRFAQPLGVATAAMTTSTIVLLIPGVLALPEAHPTTGPVLALILLGTVFTAATLSLFYGLIARSGPATATLAFYLSPAFTVVLSWTLFDVSATWSTLAGLAAIVLGSAMAARRVRVEGP
jgi:drug/metabolite transporter (DMT)-like permease